YHADLARDEHEVLVAHQFGDRRRNLRRDATRHRTQYATVGRVVQEPFPELADGQSSDLLECGAVQSIKDQVTDVVLVGVDQRTVYDVAQGQIGQHALGRHTLALRPRREPGELVPRLRLVGLGEEVAKVVEDEVLMT